MAYEKILGDIIGLVILTGRYPASPSEREWYLYSAFVRRLFDNWKSNGGLPPPTDEECEAALAVRERLMESISSVIQVPVA